MSTYLALHLSDIANAFGYAGEGDGEEQGVFDQGVLHIIFFFLVHPRAICTELLMSRRAGLKGKEEASWGAMDDDLGDRLGPGLAWADDIDFP